MRLVIVAPGCCLSLVHTFQTLGPFVAPRFRNPAAINHENGKLFCAAFITSAIRRGEKQLESFLAVRCELSPMSGMHRTWPTECSQGRELWSHTPGCITCLAAVVG